MKIKRTLAEAQEVADALIAELSRYCERIEIAGSLRRGKAEVGDLELVAVPKWELDFFGSPTRFMQIDGWLYECGITPTKDGSKYKQFIYH